MQKLYFQKEENLKMLTYYVKKYAEVIPNNAAINFYGREVSYRELDELSDRLATAIDDMGYKKGDRVIVFLQTCPQCHIAYLAAMKLGLIIVPLDAMSKEFELDYTIKDSGAKLIIALDQLYPIVEKVRDRCEVKDVIVTSFHDFLQAKPELPIHPLMEPSKETFSGAWELLDLIEKYPPNPPKPDVSLSDNGWIIYTGGTTGMPKGCLHTYYNNVVMAATLSRLEYKNTKDDKMLIAYPLTHMAGLGMGIFPALFGGSTLIPLVRWDPVVAMKAIEKYHITILNWITAQFINIINHPEVKKYDLLSVRFSGFLDFQLQLDKKLLYEWYRLTYSTFSGHLGYGMTEVFTAGVLGAGLPFVMRNVGVGSPGVEVKIVNEKGEEVPTGQEGEILLKSLAQFKEYWNKPDKTKEDIIDGWFHTGDLGKMDEYGSIEFLGRKKEILKISGYTVAPEEIENIGEKNPAIAAVAIIGVPDLKKGEIPKAFVVLKPGYELNSSDIEEWFKQNISAIKIPIVEIRKELPMLTKGAISKKALREEEAKKRK